MMPPTGRIRNDTPNVASDRIRPMAGGAGEKKAGPNTSADAVPKMKKS